MCICRFLFFFYLINQLKICTKSPLCILFVITNIPEKQWTVEGSRSYISSENIKEDVKLVLKKSLVHSFQELINEISEWDIVLFTDIESCRCVVPIRQLTRLRPHRCHKQQLLFIFNIFQTRRHSCVQALLGRDRCKDINKPVAFASTHIIASHLKKKVCYCVHPEDVSTSQLSRDKYTQLLQG